MINRPLLSIITSIYNGGDYILKFLDAISKQTYENIELIIVEDCSTDIKTLEIVNKIKNNQIPIKKPYKIIQNNKNLGAIYAFQEGLKYASGEYFAFPGSDDFMDDDFYSVMMNEAITKKCDVVKGLLLCCPNKNEPQGTQNSEKNIIPLLENIKLPIEIRNPNGQIISFFMPDITYCWFHVFSKNILMHNSNDLNFINAVQYGVSDTLYNQYKKSTITPDKGSFYYYMGHKQFIKGGIYNNNSNDYIKALLTERSILDNMLNNYNKALNNNYE